MPPSAAARSSTSTRRADARRNIVAIVDAAAVTLARDPRASMQDVADACGLHRATVHRHFPSRGNLVLAVRDHALAGAATERDRIFAVVSDPSEALERYVHAMLDIGDRYRLHRFVAVVDEGTRRARPAPVARVLRRAQERGAVRTDLDPGELAVALAGLIATLGPEIATGRMTAEQGVTLCTRLLQR